MTCIAAVVYSGKVYMGGDSAAADEDNRFVSVRKEPKVFIKNEYIIGYAGSFRFGKVVEHLFSPPKPNLSDLDKFLNTTFIDSLRDACESAKIDPTNEDDSSELLIGVGGRLFEFCSDLHMGEDAHDFNAIGSGAQFALGSLNSTRRFKSPSARIKMALQSAEEFSPTVKAPFTILGK
jgi:ATP-dependent protease HslVU (ClpYQ) peptidase subunit